MNVNLKFVLVAAMALLATACRNTPQTVYAADAQQRATEELVVRVVGERYAKAFDVVVTGEQQEGRDYFAVEGRNGRIVLEGNDGVSAASALNHYLKTFCGCQITWCGTNLDLPEKLPVPESRTVCTTPYKYRYCLNYCTFNYTMSWWDEERWQWEIDFMAMNGINLPLAMTGQNPVWQKVYRELGFTDKELEGFFSGPAYFNWFWMGNLDGWGGPLPQSFFGYQEKLQKFILREERRLGMTPILSAFTGHVPPSFEQKFPDAHVKKTTSLGFPEVSVLDPNEELFTRIGRMFIEEQERMYGTNHYYSADTFNENRPPLKDSTYLSQISRKVYESMEMSDPDAVWVMQGWLFHFDREFWGQEQIDALLTSVPDDRMIILDLWGERFPVWSRTNAYNGKPWIWCMLHNFGQNINLSGNARSVANDPAAAREAVDNMKGIGLTMEGIEHTPIMYSLMLENVWRDTPIDIDQFVDEYTTQRYGQPSAVAAGAWKKMMPTVFENELTNGGNESIITGRPTLAENPGGTTNVRPHYRNRVLVEAWDMLISCADTLGGSDGYGYDLVDVTRQVLANYATEIQQQVATAFKNGDRAGFDAAAVRFLELIGDMDKVLSTRREFLLGRWLEDAKKIGTTPDESALYEQNARNLITTWGGKNCRISDYACRQWGGVMNGFYAPRWNRFFEAIRQNEYAMDDDAYAEFIDGSKEWEWQWTFGRESYPAEPSGSEVDVCRMIHDKYRPQMESPSFLDNKDVPPPAKKGKLI